MEIGSGLLRASLAAVLALAAPAAAAETPKYGGTLTYMIPADSPPSFDGHREATYATVHSAAPYYSVLIRVDPNNPGSATDFVCDLCTEIPQPSDDGKTYTFKIPGSDGGENWARPCRHPTLFHHRSRFRDNALGAPGGTRQVGRDLPGRHRRCLRRLPGRPGAVDR